MVKLKTAKNPLKRAFAALSDWCRENLHLPIREQHRKLTEKLQGHYGYYGITGNGSALQGFRNAVVGIWRKWLARRRRHGFLSWAAFGRLLKRYPLPAARVVHSVYRLGSEPVT